MNEIQTLIAAGHTDDALDLLVQTNKNGLLLQAQYNNGKKQYNLGLIDFTEWARIQAGVNNSILEFSDNNSTTTQPSLSQKNTQMNILKQFDTIFENLVKNDNARNWNVTELITAAERLDNIFQTSAFSETVESVQYGSFQNKTSVEKTQILSQFYSDLLKQHDSLRSVVEKAQQKSDNETTFQELLNAFFTKPALKTWNELSASLTTRFADRSLYDVAVEEAWHIWKQKMNQYSNEFTFGIEFGNSQTKNDLKVFLDKNLQIKNHNA